MCFAPQRRALFRHFFHIGTSKSGPRPSVFYTFDLEMCFAPQQRALFRHFFHIGTSKSGPRPSVFYTFDLEMCFAPQRRALFRHRNFQKSSDTEVFSTFWLGNVLRATTACTFSSLLWPAGSAPAALASLLFDPPEPQIIGKTQCFATSYLFAHLYLLSSYSFSSTLLSSNLSLLSASALLCFSSVHIVGSLTSKLPSTKKGKLQKFCASWIELSRAFCLASAFCCSCQSARGYQVPGAISQLLLISISTPAYK